MLDIKIFYYFVRVWNELRDLTFNALSLHCRSCIFISNWFSYFGDYLYIERSKSKSDLKISKKWYELRNTEKCIDTILGWIQLKMIETKRIKMIWYKLKNVMSVDFIALRKLLLLSQKNLHLFFCQNKNWYKTFKSILYQYHVSFMSFILADSHQFCVIIFGSLSTNTNQYKSFRQ